MLGQRSARSGWSLALRSSSEDYIRYQVKNNISPNHEYDIKKIKSSFIFIKIRLKIWEIAQTFVGLELVLNTSIVQIHKTFNMKEI